MISGIILASGMSRRMGRDKLLLPVAGIPAVERVIAAASQSELGEVILVCNSDRVADMGKRYGARIVKNSTPEIGQSHSIRLGVENACSSAEGLMFLVGDQPFISSVVINEIIRNFLSKNCNAVVPIYNGARGNPVIFKSTFRDRLLRLSGDSGGRVLLKEMKEDILTVNFTDEKAGFDIDTMEEYEAIIRLEDKNE